MLLTLSRHWSSKVLHEHITGFDCCWQCHITGLPKCYKNTLLGLTAADSVTSLIWQSVTEHITRFDCYWQCHITGSSKVLQEHITRFDCCWQCHITGSSKVLQEHITRFDCYWQCHITGLAKWYKNTLPGLTATDSVTTLDLARCDPPKKKKQKNCCWLRHVMSDRSKVWLSIIRFDLFTASRHER